MATWVQRIVKLKPKKRGCHLVTDEILLAVPEVSTFSVGLLHAFVQHTSASLTINENYDPDVRTDMETVLNRLVPEDGDYRHSMEGPDDMPAHVKSSLFGASLSIPITHGKLALGTWQGIYLCEHRDRASGRKVVITIQGQVQAKAAGGVASGAGVGAGAGGARGR